MASRLVARHLAAEEWPDHPALRAWRALGGGDPSAVLVVKEEAGSARLSHIYRLEGLRAGTAAVVAKRSLRATIALERRIYDELLARLAAPVLRCLGSLDDVDPRFAWLFLEAADGADFDADSAAHRAAGAAWLAALHTGTEDHALLAELPDRGPAHFHEHLQAARERIAQGFANPSLAGPERGADRELLDALLRSLDVVESYWEEVRDACERAPRVLVHGDFAGRNVRIEGSGPGARVWVFDWEVAGRGAPSVDLVRVDIEAYTDAVRERWPRLRVDAQARLGRLLRGCLAPIGWETLGLESPWVEQPLANLASYRRRLDAFLGESGWTARDACRRPKPAPGAGADPRAHPAAAAWRRLGRSDAGLVAVGLLQRKSSAEVYRIEGVGPSGSVVAKRTTRHVAAIERHIYECVLPRLPLRAPAFHGALDEGDACWLFLEDAGAARAEGGDARRLLTEWLARLHTSAAELVGPLALPERGTDQDRELLREARRGLCEGAGNPSLSPADRWLLGDLVQVLGGLDARWDGIERLCARMPRTLVHGDLGAQNLRLRATPEGDELLVLDWETAGIGPPAVDLVDVDAALYARCVASTWPHATAEEVRAWQRCGRILRAIAATGWEVPDLAFPWLDRALARLRIYRHELRREMAGLAAEPAW